MSQRLRLRIWVLATACALGMPGAARAQEDEEPDSESELLRQRVTEREDKRRPLKPYSIDFAGHPLTIGGEYEVEIVPIDDTILDADTPEPDRVVFDQSLELEFFYSVGKPLSVFAQFQLAMEEDLLDDSVRQVSDQYLERGELWLYTEHIGGTGFNFDIGRLDFEDDRRWWWDEELDAVRLEYEGDGFDVAIAYAQEVLPVRSDQDHIEPDARGVGRLIVEATWEFGIAHVLEVFVLRHDDGSRTELPGEVVQGAREDDSDAELTWFGARLTGVFDLGRGGHAGYWLDTGVVRGEERVVDFEDLPAGLSEATEVVRRDVHGWAFDLGVNWLPPLAWEPRLYSGLAIGSGDSTPDSDTDHGYRQTGLDGNEAGFGGVQRFAHYGVALDPELSNLRVLTVGAGRAFGRSSSLDLVFHDYRLVEPAGELLDAEIDAELTGAHRHLGHGIDAVVAIEEWERMELEFRAYAFHAGNAYGSEEGRWSVGGYAALRFAF